MAEPAIATALWRTYHARLLYEQFLQNRLYIGIGKPTPWGEESDEPEPENANETTLREPIGYQRVSTVMFLTPDVAGTVEFGETTYREIAPEDIRDEKPQYFYVEARIPGPALPLVSYRQAALLADLKDINGQYASVETLTPDQVSDPGWQILLDNFEPRPRAATARDVISFLVAL